MSVVVAQQEAERGNWGNCNVYLLPATQTHLTKRKLVNSYLQKPKTIQHNTILKKKNIHSINLIKDKNFYLFTVCVFCKQWRTVMQLWKEKMAISLVLQG